MKMGQVWSKASFDGLDSHRGGRGSVLAVTSENKGPDRVWDTADDLTAPLNATEIWISNDKHPDSRCDDPDDTVRNFASKHWTGANFALADGSVIFITEDIEPKVYRDYSTIHGSVLSGDEFLHR